MTRLGFVVALVLAVVTTARAQEYEHEFRYKPEGNPQRVNVAGDFNNWSRDATPMQKGGDNSFSATVKLNEGVQHYKFVVDGDKWVPDPNADKSLESDDGHGGKNSGVLVGAASEKFPPPEPGKIRAEAVRFDVNAPREFSAFAPGSFIVNVRAQADDAQRGEVAVDDGGRALTVPLHKVQTKFGFDQWGTVVTGLKSPQATFSIRLIDGPAVHEIPSQAIVESKFLTPDWAKTAVWYQIFPERFRNGDKANDPGDKPFERVVPWTSNWWKAAPNEAPGDANFYKGEGNVWKRRYGGDVQGVIQSLPYLQKLGVTAIYLNPVFEADSMHKYDASDYRHVDDNFGFKGDIAQLSGETDDPKSWQWTKTDKLFLDFVAKAHEMGFKVILDGVFNHVGKSHPFFQDVLKNGKNSRYADWFEITDWNTSPPSYKAWDKDNGELPVFKKDPQRGLAKGPYEHVMAITRRWLAPDGDPKKGVDGWRLDVPGDIPHPFWIEWRKTVKSAKADAYISGEIWTWAQPWLKGDQFDAVMNYRWADAAQAFFVNDKKAITPTEFDSRLDAIAYTYPYQVALANQNLFDSHDTDRFASMFVNPDLAYDQANRLQDNGPSYKKDKPTPEQWRRMQQAVAAQMAFVGAPMIYYGDEAGMWSPDDPSNRMPMTWPEMKFDDPQVKFSPEMFAWYQLNIAVRQKLPALQLGFFRGVITEDDRGVYAFARDLGDQHVYVVLNRSKQQRKIDVPVEGVESGKMINWLDPSQAKLAQADGQRPTIDPAANAPGIPVAGGVVTVTLKPYATAVLTKK